MLKRELAARHAHLGTELRAELLGKHLLVPLTRQQPSQPHHPGNEYRCDHSDGETQPTPEPTPDCWHRFPLSCRPRHEISQHLPVSISTDLMQISMAASRHDMEHLGLWGESIEILPLLKWHGRISSAMNH